MLWSCPTCLKRASGLADRLKSALRASGIRLVYSWDRDAGGVYDSAAGR